MACPHRRPTATLCALAGLAAACSTDTVPGVWTVTDSAGIEIITNSPAVAAWSVTDAPVLEIGAMDDPGPYELYRVRDVELVPDGRVVVANAGSNELRIFDADGSLLSAAGSRGHGPREFDGLGMVESYADSLMTWDWGNQRVSVRLLDGTYVRSFSLEWFDGILYPADLLGGTGLMGKPAILAVTGSYMSQLVGDGWVVDSALVSVYDLDGALVDSLWRLPERSRAVLRVAGRQTTLGVPYTEVASLAGVEDGFCHAFGTAPEIRCYDGAGLRRLIRVQTQPRPVLPEDIDAFWEDALATENRRRRDALVRMRDVMPFPDAFPAFAQLLVDDAGRLWARRYRTPRSQAEEWLVFEDGRLVARLESPAGFQVMDVDQGRVAGVWTNDLGVEFVRIYEYR